VKRKHNPKGNYKTECRATRTPDKRGGRIRCHGGVLAVMQMIKTVPKAEDVMDIMHLIYKTYHYSPESKRE
jgi:hypothetical protein